MQPWPPTSRVATVHRKSLGRGGKRAVQTLPQYSPARKDAAIRRARHGAASRGPHGLSAGRRHHWPRLVALLHSRTHHVVILACERQDHHVT